MAGVYRPRHPERTVLYRVLFHHFERFLAEYEGRFEKEHGYFRPIVFTIPKMLRVFFKYKRRLLGDLCRCALRALAGYFELLTETTITPGVIAAIQTFGDRINFPPPPAFSGDRGRRGRGRRLP